MASRKIYSYLNSVQLSWYYRNLDCVRIMTSCFFFICSFPPPSLAHTNTFSMLSFGRFDVAALAVLVAVTPIRFRFTFVCCSWILNDNKFCLFVFSLLLPCGNIAATNMALQQNSKEKKTRNVDFFFVGRKKNKRLNDRETDSAADV